MYSNVMYELGSNSSVIRDLFMYGQIKAAEIGAENVYDFSLGSPSVPAPESVKEAIIKLVSEPGTNVHKYTPAAGDMSVRKAIAESISKRFDIQASFDKIYMTCGAAASLTCSIRGLTDVGDEWIACAPFFPEYRCFVEAAGGNLKVSMPDKDTLEIDFDDLEKLITADTKGLIINTPNNPSGVVYTEDTVVKLSQLLGRKSLEYGHVIYLISDEPYREVVYDDILVPYVPKYYKNTLVCYSYSKSFSLAGDRIGYIYVSNEMAEANKVFAAIAGAGRSMGFVCAPSLFQNVIKECIDTKVDVSIYRENRDLLFDALTSYGFDCVKPEGAFYLFVKSLGDSNDAFCEFAKTKYNLLLVPSESFGIEGYMRISYCVSTEMIKRSLPSFKALAENYKG